MAQAPPTSTPDPLRTFVRLAGGALFAAAAFAVVAWPIAQRIGGEPQVQAALIATAIALAGSLLAAILPSAAIRQPAQAIAGAMLGSLGIRFAVMLALAIALDGVVAESKAMLVWLSIAQLVLLMADVAGMLSATRHLRAQAKC